MTSCISPIANVSKSNYIAALDGVTVALPGGWLNHNWVQLPKQLADSVSGCSYSFIVTCLILFVMNFIPGLSLRVSEEEEDMGLDDAQLGEFAYDYVELRCETHTMIEGEDCFVSAKVSGEMTPRIEVDPGTV